MRTVRGISYDFDGTLAYYDQDLAGLFGIFISRGVPAYTIRVCYAAAHKSGFSLLKLLDALATEGYPFTGKTRRTVEVVFREWLTSALHSYDDVDFVKRSFADGVRTAIVTFGDVRFQREKIRIVGVPYDVCKVAQHRGVKGGYLNTIALGWGGPVVHVDDDLDELNAITGMTRGTGNVYTVYLNRSGAAGAPTEHITICNLPELAHHFLVDLKKRRTKKVVEVQTSERRPT